MVQWQIVVLKFLVKGMPHRFCEKEGQDFDNCVHVVLPKPQQIVEVDQLVLCLQGFPDLVHELIWECAVSYLFRLILEQD